MRERIHRPGFSSHQPFESTLTTPCFVPVIQIQTAETVPGGIIAGEKRFAGLWIFFLDLS
jgi:hypothetical protein